MLYDFYDDKKEKKLLSPKLDVVFQVLFGEVGSEEITKDFLEAILNEKITKIDLSRNPILRRMSINDKMGILDVIIEIDNKEYCNIEMQMSDKDDLIRRILYYWAKTYSRGIQKGEFYEELKRTISVIITDFEIKGLEELEYCTKWKIIEEKERKIILTDVMEIVIIELPKIYKKRNKKDKLLEWTYFLDNPKSEEVEEIMKENEGIKKANEKLEEISDDEIMQRIAEWKADGIRLEKGRQARFERKIKELEEEKAREIKEGRERGIAEGREKGILEGIAEGREKGRLEGRAEGIEEGRKEGIKQGKKEEIIKIVKSLQKEGSDINFIMKITGLTKEEIESMQKL